MVFKAMSSLVKVARSGVRTPIILNNDTPHYKSIFGSGGPSRKASGSADGQNIPPENKMYYDCRKYSHCLPGDNTYLPFEGFGGIPTGVFRTTVGERLGPGAEKIGMYKQAEYFSYHHSTFVDMHLILRRCRQPRLDLKRKPVTF